MTRYRGSRHLCRKCGTSAHRPRYTKRGRGYLEYDARFGSSTTANPSVEVHEVLLVECLTCGYEEECACVDAPEEATS